MFSRKVSDYMTFRDFLFPRLYFSQYRSSTDSPTARDVIGYIMEGVVFVYGRIRE